MKKVSIVMCTYNGAKYLREQLDTIVQQTYPIHELIIQDDCSTDKTFSILEEYSKQYPYIQIHINEQKKGANQNFFSAIERITGDYIAFSDQDDIWELDKIEKQISAIGDFWLSGHFSKPFSEDNVFVFVDTRKPNYGIERAIYQPSIPGHTMLLKKEIAALIPKDSKNTFMYDHLFQIVAAAYDKIFFHEEILTHQRRHHSAATYTIPLNTKLNLTNCFQAINRTFFLYIELRDALCSRFNEIYKLLKSLPEESSVKTDAENLAFYQSKKGLIFYLKSAFLCVKLRKKIFYAKEKNNLFSILRAIYFPISCVDYIRYMSKTYTH